MVAISDLEAAENSVIGAIMLSNGRILDELSLTPDDFWSTRAATVFSLAMRLRSAGRAVDPITIQDAAKDDPATKALADPAWMHDCMHRTPTIGAAPHYADIVREHAIRRRLRLAGASVMELATGPGEVPDLIDASRAAVEKAADIDVAVAQSFGETIDATLDALEKPPAYLPTPWPSMNHMIGGFEAGRLYIIAARPAVGKTVAALQCALWLCGRGAVAFSSLEMSQQELQIRAISYALKIDVGRLIHRTMTDADWKSVADRRAKWADLPLFIDDRAGVTIGQVKQHARNTARRGKLAAVVVDYLQLISGPRGVRQSRYEIVSDVSRELKLMAKELGVPVIALSQLNRGSEGRADPKPVMSDLRESGSIEQDADVVILLHRDLVAEDTKNDMTMIVAKNRHGTSGALEFQFYGHYSEIREMYRGPGGFGNPHMDKGLND